MSGRKSRGNIKQGSEDVRYEFPMQFKSNNTKILLFNTKDRIEVIIHQVPQPSGYHMDVSPDVLQLSSANKLKHKHKLARWIFSDCLEILADYDPKLSHHTSQEGNKYLEDVYFECQKDEVNIALFRVKEFLLKLEKKIYRQKIQDNITNFPDYDFS